MAKPRHRKFLEDLREQIGAAGHQACYEALGRTLNKKNITRSTLRDVEIALSCEPHLITYASAIALYLNTSFGE